MLHLLISHLIYSIQDIFMHSIYLILKLLLKLSCNPAGSRPRIWELLLYFIFMHHFMLVCHIKCKQIQNEVCGYKLTKSKKRLRDINTTEHNVCEIVTITDICNLYFQAASLHSTYKDQESHLLLGQIGPGFRAYHRAQCSCTFKFETLSTMLHNLSNNLLFPPGKSILFSPSKLVRVFRSYVYSPKHLISM